MDIPFNELSLDLMKHMRGARSFARMDEELKLSEGQYYRLEKGLVKVKWDDFVKMTRKTGIPLRDALEKSTGFQGSPFHYRSIIIASCGQSSHQDIAKNLGVTRFVVGRWMGNKVCPSLAQMLQIIHFGTTRLPDFLDALTRRNCLPSMRAYSDQIAEMLRMYEEMPWISAILCCLRRKQYLELRQHDPVWLARTSKIPVDKVKNALVRLEALGLIKKEGRHFVNCVGVINPGVLKKRAKPLLTHWLHKNAGVIADHYPSPNRQSLASYHIFSVNKKTADAIKDLYVDFVKEMALLVNGGMQDADETYSFVLTLANFEDMRPEPA